MEYFAAAMGIFDAVSGIFGSNKQKKADEARTQLGYEDNLEKIRRREFTQEQTKGEAKAFSENAGVLHTGGSTAQGTLDTMSREFKYELDWMKQYAERAKSLGLQSASVTASGNRANSVSSGINTGLSVYGAFG